MAGFGEFEFGEEYFGDGGLDPDAPVLTRVAWIFFDGVTTYELPVNPDSASTPAPFSPKKLSFQPTCAGAQVIYEGRAEPKKISFSGVILTEAQYNSFRTWVNKNKQIRITDDLGQKFWVYLKSFSPTRRSDTVYDWLMDYTAEGFVLDRG